MWKNVLYFQIFQVVSYSLAVFLWNDMVRKEVFESCPTCGPVYLGQCLAWKHAGKPGGSQMTNEWLEEHRLLSVKNLWVKMHYLAYGPGNLCEPAGGNLHTRWCGKGSREPALTRLGV